MLHCKFGYFTNTNKTWLLTKIDHYSKAVTALRGPVCNHHRGETLYLGVPLGTDEYIKTFLTKKVELWTEELNLLAKYCKNPTPCMPPISRTEWRANGYTYPALCRASLPAFYPSKEQSEPNSSPLSQEDRHRMIVKGIS